MTQLELRVSASLTQQGRTLESIERSLQTLATKQAEAPVASALSTKDTLGALSPDVLAAIKLLETRLDGIQRYMLLQINEAREEATRWKQKANKTQEELDNWQTVMRQKYDALLAESTWLRGRLNEPMPRLQDSVSTTNAAPVKPRAALTYPGHPRATVLPDEHE
jgi:hypothetical protein